jgi:hypothetical protein
LINAHPPTSSTAERERHDVPVENVVTFTVDDEV